MSVSISRNQMAVTRRSNAVYSNLSKGSAGGVNISHFSSLARPISHQAPRVDHIYELSARDCRKQMQDAIAARMNTIDIWNAYLYRACIVRSDMTAVDLARILDVIAKTKGLEIQEFIDFMLDEVRRKVHSFSVRDTSFLFNALAKLNIRNEELLQSFQPHLIKRLPRPSVELQHPALLAFSLTRLYEPKGGGRHSQKAVSALAYDPILPILDQIVAVVTPRLKEIKDGQTLSLLFFAYTRTGNQSFVSLLESQVSKVLQRCHTIDLIYLLRCYDIDTSEILVHKTINQLIGQKLFDIKPIHFGHLLESSRCTPWMTTKLNQEMRYRFRDFVPSTCVALLEIVEDETKEVFLRYIGRSRPHVVGLKAPELLTLAQYVEKNISTVGKEALLTHLPQVKVCNDTKMILEIMRIFAKLKIRDTHWHHIITNNNFEDEQLDVLTEYLAQLSLPSVFDEQLIFNRVPRTSRFLQACGIFALTRVPETLKLEELKNIEKKPPLLQFALNEVPQRIEDPLRSSILQQRLEEHFQQWNIPIDSDVMIPHAYTVPFVLRVTEVADYIQQNPLVALEEENQFDEEIIEEHILEEEELEELPNNRKDIVTDKIQTNDTVEEPISDGIDRRTHVIVDILSENDFYHTSEKICSLSQKSKGKLLSMERHAYINVLRKLNWPVITVSESNWNFSATPDAFEKNRRYILTLISHLSDK